MWYALTPDYRIIAQRELISPRFLNCRYVGIMPPEKNIVNIISRKKNFFPGNRFRLKD